MFKILFSQNWWGQRRRNGIRSLLRGPRVVARPRGNCNAIAYLWSFFSKNIVLWPEKVALLHVKTKELESTFKGLGKPVFWASYAVKTFTYFHSFILQMRQGSAVKTGRPLSENLEENAEFVYGSCRSIYSQRCSTLDCSIARFKPQRYCMMYLTAWTLDSVIADFSSLNDGCASLVSLLK